MVKAFRCLVYFSLLAVISCDGPNQEVATSVAMRGVHNDDGFHVSVKINSGESVTAEILVSVQVSALNAKEMYITQESSCNVGGQWEPFKSFRPWNLQKLNGMNFFYAKVRNSERESECSFVSVLHDNVAPIVTVSSPLDGSTLVNLNELPLVGTCDEESRIVVTMNSQISFQVPCVNNVWNETLDTSLLPSGPLGVTVKAYDGANNGSGLLSLGYLK